LVTQSRGRSAVGRLGRFDGGRGGLRGQVKVAVKRDSGVRVAVKIIEKSLIGNVDDVMRFTREFAVLNSLHHVNIIRLFEVQQTDQHFFIFMELCERGSLRQYVDAKGGRLDEAEARAIFRQIVAAIEHCHKRGVIHRDIKPDNVLLTADMVVKVADFGLAAMLDNSDALLRTQVGTLSYVAPEILAGKKYSGAAADVWSLGVLLFVLVAGKLPFDDPPHRRDGAAEPPLEFPQGVSRGHA
jgi:5'-AMP-activated protein kinase, catalytic alpha subunit